MIGVLRFSLLLGLVCVVSARAEIYELPPEGHDVIGAVSTITARYEDTLVDIARRHGLGYEEIVRANPDVNIWVPGEGTEVVLPTQFVLPAGPRRGVVLNLAEYRMYYFPEPEDGKPAYVMTYPISIGRMDWETPLGVTKVISKVRNPTWYPPQSVRDEHAADGRSLGRIVPPGPNNPLGKFAMRLGLPGYLIHGTNRPSGVGMRVTHGCVRMFPEDIEYLFAHVDVNTPVRIINDPVKMGWSGERLVVEVHPVLEVAAPVENAATDNEAPVSDGSPAKDYVLKDPLTHVTEKFIAATDARAGVIDWQLVERIVQRADGVPAVVGERIKNAATSAAFQ
ncbi:MAG: L,D-transpeptidase family protein [Woeseiaceae bacterium]|nr:L,D-transpeptidase family protein [Woeseiaceae bacterium]